MRMNTAILAHGKNWELPIPSDPDAIRLSIESEITAEAAGILYRQGIAYSIIFSGGHTAGPAYPSEAAKMRDAMYAHFDASEIPCANTVLEEVSYDTATNLKIVKERMSELGIDEIILLTIGYHLPRVKRLATILDVPVSQAFKSDYVVRQARGNGSHFYGKKVAERSVAERSLRPLLRTTASYGLEGLGWGLTVIDPKAQHLAKFVTSKARHQAG